MELEGKTVLITGAAQRIGREIALTLARRRANVVLHFNHSRREAFQLKKGIEALGSRAFLARADFAPRDRIEPVVKKFLREVFQQVPRVDVLINNAAIFYPTPLGGLTESDWDDFLTTNLKAPFFLARELGLKMVRQKEGKIINLVDWTAFRPPRDYLPYAISKAGLIAATAGLAKALAPHVQVMSIAPGPILPAKGSTKKQQKAVIEKTLLKRFGHPRDIAATIRFLIEDTDFITGAVLPVDGGAGIA